MAAKAISAFFADAVHLQGLTVFGPKIDDVRNFRLHAKGEFVLFQHRLDRGIPIATSASFSFQPAKECQLFFLHGGAIALAFQMIDWILRLIVAATS